MADMLPVSCSTAMQDEWQTSHAAQVLTAEPLTSNAFRKLHLRKGFTSVCADTTASHSS
jgi:hypothetical protein